MHIKNVNKKTHLQQLIRYMSFRKYIKKISSYSIIYTYYIYKRTAKKNQYEIL